MKTVEILMNEHRIIESALDSFETFAVEVNGGLDEGQARKDLTRYIHFIREFADAAHHAKEENILFEELLTVGFSRTQGPVAVMLADHDQGRTLIAKLATLGTQSASWTENDREQIMELINEFSAFLKNHIYKEDNILYPMSEDQLGAPAQDDIDQRTLAFNTAQKTTMDAHLADLEKLTSTYEGQGACQGDSEDAQQCGGCSSAY